MDDELRIELIQWMRELKADHLEVYRLDDDGRAAVRRGLQEMREGKLATPEQVAEVFNRYRS